jgi:itaconate CoA-transferase
VPGLGQHTDVILAELGLGQDEIAELREQGAIGPEYR